MAPSQSLRPMAAELDDYRWLTSRETADLLSTVAAWNEPLTVQVSRLRRQLSPARTHLVLEQVALRRKAREKFAAADRMLFTARGLEQASDEIVAAYKSARFAAGGPIYDLCCGIGGDLLALARAGETTGFDRDPLMVVVAEANGQLLAEQGAGDRAPVVPTVRACDAERIDVGACRAWHIDPDRRPRGRRTTRVELHEPGVDVLERLLAQNPSAAIKLAPAADVPEAWAAKAELEWVSRARQCRQLVAWFGDLAGEPGRRRATVVGPDSTAAATIVGVPAEAPPAAGRVDAYVFEPDAAVLAAGLGGTLAARLGLAPIAPGAAYWTAAQAVDEPAVSCFEVCDVLPFHTRRLAALLRARKIGQLEIKKRGVDHDPTSLRRQLHLKGPESATLLVTRVGRHVTAILARRVGAAS